MQVIPDTCTARYGKENCAGQFDAGYSRGGLDKYMYYFKTPATTANAGYRKGLSQKLRVGMLICLLSSPSPPILHSHTPVFVGNGRGTGNGHSPLHSIAYSSIRPRLPAVPLRGPPCSAVARRPPWPAVRRVLPCVCHYTR